MLATSSIITFISPATSSGSSTWTKYSLRNFPQMYALLAPFPLSWNAKIYFISTTLSQCLPIIWSCSTWKYYAKSNIQMHDLTTTALHFRHQKKTCDKICDEVEKPATRRTRIPPNSLKLKKRLETIGSGTSNNRGTLKYGKSTSVFFLQLYFSD